MIKSLQKSQKYGVLAASGKVVHPSSARTEVPALGTLLGSCVPLYLAVHLCPSSYSLLHNKLARQVSVSLGSVNDSSK